VVDKPSGLAGIIAGAKGLARSSRSGQPDSPCSPVGKSPKGKAELSRTQLKAVRKMFPIKAPNLKPAAALQVGGLVGTLQP
jgi:hypothetical protein